LLASPFGSLGVALIVRSDGWASTALILLGAVLVVAAIALSQGDSSKGVAGIVEIIAEFLGSR